MLAAGFKHKASGTAGGIGFEEEKAPSMLAGQTSAVYTAGFKAGQSKDGGIGFAEEQSPTLSATPSALEPTVLAAGFKHKASGTAGAAGGGVEGAEPILLESNQNHATVQTDGISTALPASMGMGGGYVPMIVGCDVYNQEITGNVAASLTAASGGTNTSGPKVFCLQ